MLLWDATGFKGGMAFGRKGVGIESYEGIFRAMNFEGVVESEEPRKVSRVRYESCPDYFTLVFFIIFHVFQFHLTLSGLCDPFRARHFDVEQLDNCLKDEDEC